MTNFHQA